MGQRQSRNEATDDAPEKADYYELLGVDRNATEDELKRAYRRKALELHPDRNYGNVEHATRLFAEIQTAYEVLSDPQERAWYDSHRDVLLRGEQVGQDGEEFSYNIRMTTALEVQQLMLRFNGKVEFNDAPSGFYGGLNDFIRQLAKEEDIACQWENQNPMDYPDFGSKGDDYEDVVRPFYAAWTGFATRKSYAWKDQYRLADAPDRRIRRLMEKENKKMREEAVQEYNDAVRSFIAFVRKRDPRVANNQKSEAERQRILRDATAAQRARSIAAQQTKLREQLSGPSIPDWAQSRFKDEHEGGFSSESEVEEHEYECVVCDKTFKSEAQFKAHEKSKKHLKLVKQLRKEMGQEESGSDPPASLSQQPNFEEEELAEEVPEEYATLNDQHSDSDERQSLAEAKDPRTNGHAPSPTLDSTSPVVSDDDYATRAAVEERLGSSGADVIADELASASLDGTPATSDTEGSGKAKVGKAKQKRAKRAALNAAGAPTQLRSDFSCARCQAEFPSKTKLFDHLKAQPSHAALVSQMKGAKGGKSKKR